MLSKLTKEEFICPECGYVGPGTRRLRGSGAMERFMWYALLAPGPLYSIWRRTGKEIDCVQCGNAHVIPLDSKLGALMLENKILGK